MNEDAEVKGVAEVVPEKGDEGFDEDKALKEARDKFGPKHGEETSQDDVD